MTVHVLFTRKMTNDLRRAFEIATAGEMFLDAGKTLAEQAAECPLQSSRAALFKKSWQWALTGVEQTQQALDILDELDGLPPRVQRRRDGT
jgi:hypothetical protein